MSNDKTVTIPLELAERCKHVALDAGFVQLAYELSELIDAPAVERKPDAIIEGVMTSAGITHAIYASTVSLKDKEQVKLYTSPTSPVAADLIVDHKCPVCGDPSGPIGLICTKQSAPVLMALPKRKATDHANPTGYNIGSVDGWNSCLDAVEELNK